MDLPSFRVQVDALKNVVVALANISEAAEHVLGAYQRQFIALLEQGVGAGLARNDLLASAHALAQTIVDLAERDGLPLSHEMDRLLREYSESGVPIARTRQLPRSKPLVAFPAEAAVRHTVFVDEAGSASFVEASQPVLCLTGILVEDDHREALDLAAANLLRRYGVTESAEIHAQPLLAGAPPFDRLAADQRERMLFDFLKEGLNHAVGVHHISMLKSLVSQEFRDGLAARGLDAYTSNVLFFNATLKAAVIGEVGFVQYRYLFDRTDRYGRDIRRILRALKQDPNESLRLHGLAGEPVAVESEDYRFIQLADVVAYFLVRYRQFEVKTFQPREALRKHESKYYAAYDLIRPKLMSYVDDGLYRLVDWKALQEWAMPLRGDAQRAPIVGEAVNPPKTPRNAPCPCGSGRKFKRCHGHAR
jgi:hypothetical protein